jgi:hypothetical protein
MEVFMKSKSKWFFTGMTVFLLSFGLIMAGCNNDEGTAGGNAPVGSNNNNNGGGGGNNNNGGGGNNNNGGGGNNNNGGGGGNDNTGDNNPSGGNNPSDGNNPSGGIESSVVIVGEVGIDNTLTATTYGFASTPVIKWEKINQDGEIAVSNEQSAYTITVRDIGYQIRAFAYVKGKEENRVNSEYVGPIIAKPSQGGDNTPQTPETPTPELRPMAGNVTISGEPYVGQILTAVPPLASNNQSLASWKISYQWQISLDPAGVVDYRNLRGETGPTYKTIMDDLNKHIRVVVRYDYDGFASEIASFDPNKNVPPMKILPTRLSGPAKIYIWKYFITPIKGWFAIGDEIGVNMLLYVTTAEIRGIMGSKFDYRWQHASSPNPLAWTDYGYDGRGNSFLTTENDKGQYIRVIVTMKESTGEIISNVVYVDPLVPLGDGGNHYRQDEK